MWRTCVRHGLQGSWAGRPPEPSSRREEKRRQPDDEAVGSEPFLCFAAEELEVFGKEAERMPALRWHAGAG